MAVHPIARWQRKRLLSAFTLVELLVAIGIIAILIGILLPVLGKAKEAGNRTGCLANLRSLGLAMYHYASDFHDRLPNGNPDADSWSTGAGATALIPFATDYVNAPKVFQCPSDRDPAPTAITVADYDITNNSALMSYDFYSIHWAPNFGPFLNQLKGQAPLAWDLDGGQDHPSGLQNHGYKGGNVLFADGHAEWQDQPRWIEPNWPYPAQDFFAEPLPDAPVP